MTRHVANAVFGVLDYAAYPAGMLLVAPIIIRHLGAVHFGMWAFGIAIINTGSIVASGFGDANIRQIAIARANQDCDAITACVRTTMAIHLLLGSVLAAVAFASSPYLARQVARGGDLAACAGAFRFASACIAIRAVETVPVSTFRAFERYFDAVRISTATRLASLAFTAVLAVRGTSVPLLFAGMGIFLSLGTAIQLAGLIRLLSPVCLVPMLRRNSAQHFIKFGALTWVQTTCNVMFGQVDRLIVGVAFGALSVGAYSICAQIAQPIAGTAAAGLHFIFPALARTTSSTDSHVAKSIIKAFLCNLTFVVLGSAVTALFGSYLIRAWTSSPVAAAASGLLPWCIAGSACTAMATTGVYALLALGRPAAVVRNTALSGLAMIVTLLVLRHDYGVVGVSVARLAFGLTSLWVYVPLAQHFGRVPVASQLPGSTGLNRAGEAL